MRETLKGIINAGILSAAAAGLAGCTYAEGCAIMAQGERNNIERERNAILAHQGPQVVYVQPEQDVQRHGTLKGEDGSSYTGEILNGRAHGRGTWLAGSGKRYTGEFRNGNAEGQMIIQYPDGGSYKGEMHGGKKEGYGKYVSGNGQVWDGYWKDDEFVGKSKSSN